MTNTLQDFIVEVDKKIVVLFESKGAIYPMYHTVTRAGDHNILTPPGEKDIAAIVMRAYFELADVVRYVFVNEAWQLYATKLSEDEMREIAKRGLADYPGRIEVLMYVGEDDSGTITAHRTITRPSHGKAELGPLEIDRPRVSEGRMVGMLPQRGQPS